MQVPNPRIATLLIILYVIHFFLARWMTIKLIERNYIQRNSPEFNKAVLFWFAPIVGVLGLCLLFLVNKFIVWWKWFSKWIKLSHYSPEPIAVSKSLYREEEILQRAELIKEKERLEFVAKKSKQRKKVKK